MPALRQDRLFVALTRPQMFAGVTYRYFIINAVVTAELFLIFRTLWAFAPALIVHLAGVLICLQDSRALDVYLNRSMRCPRIPNYRLWRCNSYRA